MVLDAFVATIRVVAFGMRNAMLDGLTFEQAQAEAATRLRKLGLPANLVDAGALLVCETLLEMAG